MVPKILFTLLTISLYLNMGILPSPQSGDIKKYDWNASAANVALLNRESSAGSILTLLKSLMMAQLASIEGAHWDESIKVRQYRFIDLDADGTVELVLTPELRTWAGEVMIHFPAL
jgi:hypothetical protein